MRMCLLVAGLLSAAASAEPMSNAASEPAKTAPAESPRAPIVLASADALRASATDAGQSATAPAKRRIAPRITTCRCGPVQPQPDPEPEDQ